MEVRIQNKLTLTEDELGVAIFDYLKSRGVALPPAAENMTLLRDDGYVRDIEVVWCAESKIDLLAK